MLVPRMPSVSLGSPRVGRLRAAFYLALVLLAVGAIRAQSAEAQEYILINNGLAPPNAENVIDSSDPNLLTIVRNVGCPPSGTVEYGACPSTGAPTWVEIVAGALLPGGSLSTSPSNENAARDSSIVSMSGGTVGGLSARESARLTVSDGSITLLKAFDDSFLTFSGGEVTLYLEAWGNATVRIQGGTVGRLGGGVTTSSSVPVTVSGGSFSNLGAFGSLGKTGSYIFQGSNFALNGVSAAYGDYPFPSVLTTLTGTWESGEDFSVPISAPFTLEPPAASVPALPLLPALALAAVLLAIGAAQIRRQRAA